VPTQRASLGLAPALPGIVLVIVIAWALAAVLMLTGTLINAREIKDDVTVINNQVSPIDKDLQSVALAAETVKISARINAAAQPLTGQATQILQAARRIDASARSILTTAGQINQTARQINGTVTQINGTVVSINGKVAAIGGSVGSISGKVGSIGSRVASIRAKVGSRGTSSDSISANVIRRIQPTFLALDPVVTAIDHADPTRGVQGINERLDVLISSSNAAGIKTDLDKVLAGVGEIDKHANSINCGGLLFVQSLGDVLAGGPANRNRTPGCSPPTPSQ